MAKRPNTAADTVFKSVTASTNNENDRNYYHYFEQKSGITLTFEVEINSPSVDSIYFVLWNLNDPVNPVVAEPVQDVCVVDGKAKIEISDEHFHLGPGPYCATLTALSPAVASTASKGFRQIVGNAVYYYDTWKDSRRYPWPALS